MREQTPDAPPRPPPAPKVAALWSALVLGAGQVYNRQLEKAVLLWIAGAVLAALAVVAVLLGLLARALPTSVTPPPLGDWVARHPLPLLLVWLAAATALWGLGIRDALVSAGRIARGEVVIVHGLRRQAAHILASQLLGLIPVVGLFFPPGVVAEAVDAVRDRRRPHAGRLLREGGQAIVEWLLLRVALYALAFLAVVWVVWWIVRALGVPI